MKYANVSCSQCGRSFGPGDHGFSHCENHPGFVRDMKEWQERLMKIAKQIESHASELDPRYDDPKVTAQWLKPYVGDLRDVLNEMNPPRKRSKPR